MPGGTLQRPKRWFPVIAVEGVRSNRARDTVRKVRRLTLAMLLLALSICTVGTLPTGAPVAHAEDNCGKVVPVDAIDGVVFGTGGTGAFTIGAPGAIANGGASLTSMVGAAVGEAAIAAAVGWTVFSTGCKFLDWTGWDFGSGAPLAPTMGDSSVTVADPVPCWGLPGMGGGGFNDSWCIDVTFPSTPPSGTQFRQIQGTGAPSPFTLGANNFYPATFGTDGAPYTNPSGHAGTWSSGGNLKWILPGSTATTCQFDTGTGFGCTAWSSPTVRFVQSGCVSNLGALSTSFAYACGQHPSTIVVGYIASSSSVQAVFHLNPTVRTLGWARKIVTDVRCTAVGSSGGSHTWVRATSPAFYDKAMTSRVEVPTCALATQVPTQILVYRVPMNYSICSSGVACYGSKSILYQATLPASLTTTGTAPDWLECLSSAMDCGAPELSGGTCTWGGHTVDVGFCDPDTQAGNETTNPTASPRLEQAVDTTGQTGDAPFDTALAPEVPPDDGGSGVTVNIPIDDGQGDRGGTLVLEADEDECWPEGWGWFNPAEWVYRPIKCALVWAFVPSDPSGWVEEQWDELETEIPFSYGAALVSFLDTVTDPDHDAAGTELFCAPDIPLPDYEASGVEIDGGSTDACIDIEQAAAGAHATPMLDELLQWCLVGYVLYRFMRSTLGSLL